MNAIANEASVRLWSQVSNTGNMWTVVPHVDAPAGRVFGYEIAADKTGDSGTSKTRQTGTVSMPATATASLSSLTIGIAPHEHCVIEIKLFEGSKTIDSQTLTLPGEHPH